ncbi:DUF427 domain-containing protein [soil metagenome]
MTLTLGNGPFGPRTTGQFNFERVGPAHAIYWEDWPRRMRARFNGEVVLDSRRGKALHETGLLPVLYFPEEDLRADLVEPSDTTTHCPFKGDASYLTLRVGDRVAEDLVWTYPEPIEGAPPLAGYVALYFDRLDGWLEEDEEVDAHPKDPYHRVDVLAGSYHVVVRSRGEVVAETDRPKLLFETGLPIRWYLPPEDVRTERLRQSETVSDCPYKGRGQHWHLDPGGAETGGTERAGERHEGAVIEDAAWSLPEPRREGLGAAGHFCFYPEKVDLEVDGEPVTS